MSIAKILTDSFKYPFSNIAIFLIVGVLALLGDFQGVYHELGFEGTITSIVLFSIIAIFFRCFLYGYSMKVIKKGIENSNELPEFDFANDFVSGFKAFVITVVYFIIPMILSVIFSIPAGAIGYGLDLVNATVGFVGIIVLILFIVFGTFEMVATCRFANTGKFRAAFEFGEVIGEVKNIGFLKMLSFAGFFVVAFFVVSLVMALFNYIPYVGIIIASILIGGFMVLFYSKSLGMFYAEYR